MTSRESCWHRSDVEKIQSQWKKLSGLHNRAESSAAIVRAATAAELAATFAIRREFAKRSQFSAAFVDSLLLWANGLIGKFDRLLLPLTADDEATHEVFKMLHGRARTINNKRNSIVHRGEFCNPDEAREIIELTRKFVNHLVRRYHRSFYLDKLEI